MKSFIIAAALCLIASIALADTTQSRDGDGNKIQGAAFGAIKSASIGTKGFKCWSTSSYISWEVKAAATASTSGAGVGFKMFYNGTETTTYPVSDAFFQWQNAPTSRTPTVTKVCLRGYSTATEKTAYGVFQ